MVNTAELKQILKLATVALMVAILFFSGVLRLADARRELLDAHSKYASVQSEVASLPREEKMLEQAKRVWAEEKKNLWRSAETGVAFKDIENAVRESGARLLAVKPGNVVVGPFRNHLRAVPVKVKMRGTFPAVLNAVSHLERLVYPGEVRQFRITTNPESEVPGEVEAEADLVLYSLNPPEVKERAPGSFGRYDPFFPLVVPAEQPTEKQEKEDSAPVDNTLNKTLLK